MRAQKPAKGIMLDTDFGDAKVYHVECECSSADHSVKMWIEVDSDSNPQDIQVGFYADTWTPWWDKNYNRFKCIWRLLTTGIMRYEHHMILSKQSAINFANVILDDVKKLEEKKNVKNRSRKYAGTVPPKTS